ncbi:MAG: AAA family ATPase [Eubacteriales bacterium]|nr:AAA family ATPase [Eubacteriales bacterium]
MDTETQNTFHTVMSIAGRIDKSLMKEQIDHENVQELLRIDLRNFLVFLTVADHIVAKDEIRYINKSLGYNFDANTMKRFATESEVMRDTFLNDPPKSMRYFLKYANDIDTIPEAKYYNIKKLYIMLYQELGEDFLSNCRHVDVTEVNQLTRYRFMLESKAKAYDKSGTMSIRRPDSIPFKRKEKEHIEANTEKEPETTFIGSISGGDKTIDDLDSLLKQLDGLIGLQSVKTEVKNLINLLKIIELRTKNGLKAPSVAKHFVFTGNPGTGKTTVARLLSEIFCALGILSKGHIVEVDRSGLVAGYMGQTAIKVKEVIDQAIGGVLFIDEAYSLSNDTNGNDFGKEAIDTLVKAMEDNRDNLIVIVAGYPDLMEQFIDSNPGLKSRFQKTIAFPDYDANELFKIFENSCNSNDYHLDDDAKTYVHSKLEEYVANKDANFGNARDIRNFIDVAISAQANRLLENNTPDADALTTLTVEDVQSIF